MAGQGGDGSVAGRRFLGSRARAPGLSGEISERIHLPLPAPELAPAGAREGVTRKAESNDSAFFFAIIFSWAASARSVRSCRRRHRRPCVRSFSPAPVWLMAWRSWLHA